MRAVHDCIEGPFAIGEDMALYGTITGNATLQGGVRFILHGTIMGDLTIEPKARAILHGTIAGRIYNKGGRVEIFGMAGAVENLSRHAAFTTAAPFLGKYETTPFIAPAAPLRVCAGNPRYFADASGRPVYLTGSRTWLSLQDGILSNYTAVTQPFDYAGYLSLLQTNHHNFIRLWRWELTTHEPQP